MTRTDLIALAPLMTLGGSVVLATLAAGFLRRRGVTMLVALLGLAAAGLTLDHAGAVGPHQVTPLLVMDAHARVYIGMILAAGAAVMLLAHGYLGRARQDPDELYLLMLLGVLGASVLAAATHFASFFLGLEILTVSLYALVGYVRTDVRSVEAGIKYLVLAGATSATLLFGMALVYAEVGSMGFDAVAQHLAAADRAGALLVPGLVIMLAGIGFKLALVPFHMWTPDVYQGAPAPATAFLATVSKGAVVAVLVRLLAGLGGALGSPALHAVFGLLAVASMIAGNVLALLQDHLKRILAYSSIAHLGYVLVAVVAGGRLGAEAVAYYVMAYFVTTLIAFGVVTVLSRPEEEADHLRHYRGLAWRRPGLALALAASMLSLAGIPLTAGFIGKVYVAAAGVHASQWALVLLLAINSAVGLFYYLRVIATLFGDAEEAPSASSKGVGWPAVVSLGALGLLLVWLGVYPRPIQSLAALAASAL